MRVCLRANVDHSKPEISRWISAGVSYPVLSVEQIRPCTLGFRIVSDDNGTPVLFESALFDVVDPVLSPGWVVIGVEECTLELGFPVFGAPGFWERYFDGDLGARRDYEEIGRWL